MKYYIFSLFFLVFVGLNATEKTREDLLKEESNHILERSMKIADQFYSLEKGQELKEITENILQSNETKEAVKQLIRSTGRRFFLFTYPSDGFQIKGYLSFVPNPEENSLLIFLRGGNRMFGLMHPATDFTCRHSYTVLATTYRGGVSEGVDEFGGDDVNDVYHLVKHFPVLQKKLGMAYAPKKTFMLGGSRGAMQMFLALVRFPSLQNQVTKVASLSGLLSIKECMADREDMRDMFIKDFGLEPDGNEQEWIAQRDLVEQAAHLRKDLPILILQGTDDLRVSLNEGYQMIEALESNGNLVNYIEVPGGDHCLANQPDRVDLIVNWFED